MPDILEKMGASVIYGENFIEVSSGGSLKAIDADFNLIPDAAMTVAILALYANGTSVLRNIGSWRVKKPTVLQQWRQNSENWVLLSSQEMTG